jgi:hypothetical protein
MRHEGGLNRKKHFNRKERIERKEKRSHAEGRRKPLQPRKTRKARRKIAVILREVAESIKTASREGVKPRRRKAPF